MGTSPESGKESHGILFHGDVRLVCFRPAGRLDEESLRQLVKTLEEKEDAAHALFDRFTDTSHLTAIDLDLEFVYRIALHRRAAYEGRHAPIKSAFYVTSVEAARVVGVHARATEHSPLQVRLFEDLESAARWLGVPRTRLELS